MPSAKELPTLIEKLLATISRKRGRDFNVILDQEEARHADRGILDSSIYQRVLVTRACEELRKRAELKWVRAQKVIEDSKMAWDDEVKERILDVLTTSIKSDARVLAQMANQKVSGRAPSVSEAELGQDLALMCEELQENLELFALTYRGRPADLSELLSSPRYKGVRLHWQKAIAYLENDPIDLSNAAKEAVFALEAMAKVSAGIKSGTLSDATKVLRKQKRFHGAFLELLDKTWGYANDVPGLRHGSPKSAEVPESEARYFVDASEAAIRLLLARDAVGLDE